MISKQISAYLAISCRLEERIFDKLNERTKLEYRVEKIKEAGEELNCENSMSILVAINFFEIVLNKKLVYDVQNDVKSVQCLTKSPKVSYNTHNIFEYFREPVYLQSISMQEPEANVNHWEYYRNSKNVLMSVVNA